MPRITKLRTPYYFPSTEELGKLKDGTYFGEVSLPPYDYAKVKITVNDNAVKEFIILDVNATWWIRRKNSHLKIYEIIPNRFINAQSPHIDTITGATGSCRSLKIAFTSALWHASGKEDPMMKYLHDER